MPAAAIILAAGASRRLGQPKQLVRLRGETLLARAIRLAVEAGASPVIAVLGGQFEVIREAMPESPTVFIRNENWEQGIATSIHAGLAALEERAPEAECVLLMGCDQPRLETEHLRLLLEESLHRGEPTIVASKYAGIFGVPAVFPAKTFSDLMGLRGDKGARSVIAQAPYAVLAVDFPGGEVDIDSPQDLAKLEPDT